jgi:predicted RNase H-like HicB family nuclease
MTMEKTRFIYWQEDGIWIGYLEKYPGYMTEGETIEELKKNLIDVYKVLSRGDTPCVRKMAELEVT